MNIIVCMKQVIDPEGPPGSYVINPETKSVEPKGIPPVLSLFDENALEAALRIKDADKENVKIKILSIGRKLSNAILQKALAVGADELIKVEDEKLEPGTMDSCATAHVLASAINKMGEYDLILTGRQSADLNASQAGIGIAEILGIPVITLARKVAVDNGDLIVERVIPNGYEVVKTSLPAVVMVSNETGEMRYPTMLQRREAKKKPVTLRNAAEIGFTGPMEHRVVLRDLSTPRLRQKECRLIEGASPEDAGRKLAEKLAEQGII